MAKDRVTIPTIKISNQRAGTAFGGVIYSSDVSVGYNGEPTKLNINVVLDTKLSKKRDFLITKNDLNLASPLDIKVGGYSMFHNMFLSSYNINTGIGQKTLNLSYVDGSALLSRIYVGLIHQHFQVDKEKHMVPNVVEFDVDCPKIEIVNVDNTQVPVCSDEGSVPYKNIKTYRLLASPTGIPGRPYQVFKQSANNIWQGGWIVLGREEFTEVNCDMSDVSYGFDDLVSALENPKNGFHIKVDRKRYTMTKDSNLLLRSYTGTVKDVLQSWANDLKISYFWDFTQKSPVLVISNKADKSVDALVEACVKNIEELDKTGTGNDLDGRTGLIINSKSESVTLDGTVSQAFSSNFNIGPRAKTTSKRKTSEIFFSCQTMQDIANSGTMGGRNPSDVKVSAGLGKYSKDLRDIWNIRKAIAVHSNFNNSENSGLEESIGYYNAVGFSDVIPVTYANSYSPKFLNMVMGFLNLTQMISTKATSEANSNFLENQKNPGSYQIFIGLYDERLKTLSSSIEDEISGSFLGKHYLFGAPKSENFDASSSYKLHETAETKPSSTYYSMNQHYKTPMAKFAQKIQDLRLNSLASSEDIYKNQLFTEQKKMKFNILDQCAQKERDKSLYRDSFKRGFYHFEREAPWATYQEDIDSLLNPHELALMDWNDSEGEVLYHDNKERIKVNLLKEFTPSNHEFPVITQFMKKMPSKIFNMLAAGEASDKKVVVCLVKGQGAEGSMSMNGIPGGGASTTIGDLLVFVSPKTLHPRDTTTGRIVETKGGKSNPIEEMNALRSLCDRTSSAKSDAVQEHKTFCERDFTEELCSSINFGQADKSCGEAEATKDSLYSVELEPDVRENKQEHGIYSDYIRLQRTNPDVKTKKTTGAEGLTNEDHTEKLYSDTRDPKKITDNNYVDIIYPSENPHNGMLIYNRNLTVTDLGLRKVFDPINGNTIQISPQASSVSYQLKDISQDITSLISEERKNSIRNNEIPQNIVADVDNLTGRDGNTSHALLQTITAQAYHERLRGNIRDIQVEEPRKSYTFKIYIDSASKEIETLIGLLKPENGLDSLSINMDEGGLSISVSLSNRASADVALEEIFNKVGPLAREVKDKYATQRSNSA